MSAENLTPFFTDADKALLLGKEVRGWIDAGFDNTPVDGAGPVGSSPAFTLPAVDVPARPEGLQLVITTGLGAGTYKIGSHTRDGTGLATLHLLPT